MTLTFVTINNIGLRDPDGSADPPQGSGSVLFS